MSAALQALRNAQLSVAMEELKKEVRREPANWKHRVFLFQLQSVVGDWEKALTQLNVARDMNAECLAMAQTYQELLHCEVYRAMVFSGERSPLFFGEPETWLALITEALRLDADGKHEQAQKLRSEAYEQAPPMTGSLRVRSDEPPADPDEPPPGEKFEWIADADSRIGPILEGIVNGRYYWIPFHRIKRVDFEKPADLRDVVWLPAHFQWVNGGEAVGFVPSRYPGSETSADDLIRLARKTEWNQVSPDVYLGSGQRVLSTSENDYSLLDVEQILIDAPPAAAT